MSTTVAAWLADPRDWDGTVRYGPGVPDERAIRWLGNLQSKRALLLGCGAGQLVAETAASGAKVIGVDPSPASVALARQRCLERGLMVEVHQGELAELAFVRADTIDVAVSVLSLAGVADLPRVFRQVHRVLRPDAPVVFSLPHPTLRVAGSPTAAYGEPEAVAWQVGEVRGVELAHTIETVFTALTRTGFRVDNLAELVASPPTSGAEFWDPAMARSPAVLLVRARKMGARPTTA